VGRKAPKFCFRRRDGPAQWSAECREWIDSIGSNRAESLRDHSALRGKCLQTQKIICCNEYLLWDILEKQAGGRLRMASLKREIAQRQPFSSVEEETLLNLIRTADSLQRTLHVKIRDWGVTSTQYNVLRILRGAQPDGLTCAAIGARMITAEPDITRLLSRLKALKLIRQRRDRHDRRVVWTQISEAGLELLNAMEPQIQKLPIEALGHMSHTELAELIRLLELARKADGDSISCDGNKKAQQPVAAAPEHTNSA
jgi:DNA-binding MarR family transcriptional regulator